MTVAAVMLEEFWRDGPDRNVPDGKRGVGVARLRRAWASGAASFVGNGMWVTGVADPDGYVLFFESVTDVPDETVFTD